MKPNFELKSLNPVLPITYCTFYLICLSLHGAGRHIYLTQFVVSSICRIKLVGKNFRLFSMLKQIWCGSLINSTEGDDALLVASAARSKSTRISISKAHEPQVTLVQGLDSDH